MKLPRTIIWLLLILSMMGYITMSYFIERSNFPLFFSLYTLLFISFGILIYILETREKSSSLLPLLIGFGIAFRVLGLFAFPNLSDDYYRFLWDGHLLNAGINPYSVLPSVLGASTEISDVQQFLLSNMNSPDYFTIYPPLNQFIFYISALVGLDNLWLSVVTMKLFLMAAEIGTIVILPRLLAHLNLSPHMAMIYILNPLVIIETVGNLHFEGITVFLLIITFYLLIQRKFIVSSLYFGLACGVKLIPFILAPLIIKYLGLKKSISYFALSFLIFLILFLPYVDQSIVENFQSSLLLYFRSFEFNASIYYLVRSLGYYFVGYNIIQSAGWVLSILVLFLVIGYSYFQKKESIESMFYLSLITISTFYFLSTTVHPWYLINLIIFSILIGRFWFVFTWTYLIGLSYFTYSTADYQENTGLLIVEYSVVFAVFMSEIYWFFKGKNQKMIAE